MLKTGKDAVLVTPGSVVTIQSDGEFHVYGYNGPSLLSILGPSHSNDRRLSFRVPSDVTRLEVKCKPQCKWQLAEALLNGQEHPDPTPLEIPLGHEQPESLEESMRRFIRSEVLAQHAAQQQAGSFEEEDDFDIEDDEPDPFSPYEINEMEEEHPLPVDPPPNKEEAPEPLPPGEGLGTSDVPSVGEDEQPAPQPASPG